MSKNLNITRVDLNKNGQSVSLVFGQTAVSKSGDDFNSDNKIKIHKEPSEDLTNAFIKLVPHLLWVTQLYGTKSVKEDFFDNYEFVGNDDMPEFKGVNVTGVIISGKDNDFVQLIGTKTTDKKEVVSISAPRVWLEDVSEKAYIHLGILAEQVNEVIKEAEAFYNGKFKPTQQQELQLT